MENRMTDREIMRSHKMAEYMYLHATDEEFGQDAKQMYVLGLQLLAAGKPTDLSVG